MIAQWPKYCFDAKSQHIVWWWPGNPVPGDGNGDGAPGDAGYVIEIHWEIVGICTIYVLDCGFIWQVSFSQVSHYVFQTWNTAGADVGRGGMFMGRSSSSAADLICVLPWLTSSSSLPPQAMIAVCVKGQTCVKVIHQCTNKWAPRTRLGMKFWTGLKFSIQLWRKSKRHYWSGSCHLLRIDFNSECRGGFHLNL
jgi:hypothetical protein